MPPRIPKRHPKWLPLLFDFLSQSATDDAQDFYDAISSQAESQWENFVLEHALPPAPPKPRDPAQTLKKTLEKFSDAVESAPRRNRERLINDFSESLQNISPELKGALYDKYPVLQDTPIHDAIEEVDADQIETNNPIRVHVSKPNKDRIREKTRTLYSAFQEQASEFGIDNEHPIVASVEQLYGVTRDLIDTNL